ncbi:MAG: VanZ family protein [Planctomycetaceae bacterium]
MRQRSSFSISRQVHIILCGLCLLLVSWALLSRDPMALVRGSRLSFVQTISDVILHFGVYSVFSLCCLSLTRRSSDSPVRRTILFLLILHGVGTELLQGLIPTRTCDARDALANLTGITAGALLAAWATRQTTATSPVTRAG